jgi:hypothetical protein
MAVLPVLHEGLDPLTCSVPLPSTLPFLHGNPQPVVFAGRQVPFTALLTLLFPDPITSE